MLSYTEGRLSSSDVLKVFSYPSYCVIVESPNSYVFPQVFTQTFKIEIKLFLFKINGDLFASLSLQK